MPPTKEYMREYRQRRPEYRLRNRAKTNARTAAALRLAKLYPATFAAILAEEEWKRGIR